MLQTFVEIAKSGLNYAYHMRTQPEKVNDNFKSTHMEKPKRVVIVGAGRLMSGLCAAYELAHVRHKVTIIEKQSRVGGRVKTHFSKGLWADQV